MSLGVEVHAKSTQTGCNSIFRADATIVSVPLGVLKANTVSFHPPLPEWKTQAIGNLGFGLLNKVGLTLGCVYVWCGAVYMCVVWCGAVWCSVHVHTCQRV